MEKRLILFSFVLSVSLAACGGSRSFLPHETNGPSPSVATDPAELRIFRRGDDTSRTILAGVYPGDQVQLEARSLAEKMPVQWKSENPAMGSISTAGELTLLQAGEFSVFAEIGATREELRIRVGTAKPFLGGTTTEPPFPTPTVSPSPEASESPSPSPTASAGPSVSPTALPSPTPSAAPSDPFVDEVVSFVAGEAAGFGSDQLPDIVLGAPRGSGIGLGSFHVLSLGKGGVIILKSDRAILNGAGADFIVFENAFYAGGNPNNPFAEPGQVSVSQDGLSFFSFPCEAENTAEQYPGCAGVHPVFANSEINDIDPTDPTVAGGDAFDLAELDLDWARYIKIHDLSQNGGGNSAGFDLDAISIIHQ